jgi:hypothetical protein
MSPTLDNESSKSHRDSFEIDLDSYAEGNKVDHYSEEGKIFLTDEKLHKFRHMVCSHTKGFTFGMTVNYCQL